MPDEEQHALTIRIETNAAQAAEDTERLDDAQQNAEKSAQKLIETERHGSTADARRVRLRAKYIRQYLRDIKEIRNNTENTAKSVDKLRSKEKQSDRDSEHGQQRTIKNTNVMLKRLLAVAATLALVKRGFQALGTALDFGKNYELAAMMTGTDSVKMQMWERLLRPYGGNLNTAASGLGNVQRNIAMTNMGYRTFDDTAFRLLGDAIMTRPGMTQQDFLRNIAPRMQQLSRAEALIAGKSVGLTDDLALLLNEKGADFEAELEKQREAARLAQEETKAAQQNRQKFDDVVQGVRTEATRIANLLTSYLPDNPKILEQVGAIALHVGNIAAIIMGLKLLKWLGVGAGVAAATTKGGTTAATIKAVLPFLFNPFTAGTALVALPLVLQGLGYKKYRDRMNNDPEFRKHQTRELNDEKELIESTKYDSNLFTSRYRAPITTDTPLNFAPTQVAWQMGAQAGGARTTTVNGGDTTLNLGGITINAPENTAESIKESVIEAGQVVLAAFADLDRMNAKNELA